MGFLIDVFDRFVIISSILVLIVASFPTIVSKRVSFIHGSLEPLFENLFFNRILTVASFPTLLRVETA